MRVSCCVCINATFDELKKVADEHGSNFQDLVARTDCCTGCGSCEPYVRLMLRTGQTKFPVLRRNEIERVMKELDSESERSVMPTERSAEPLV